MTENLDPTPATANDRVTADLNALAVLRIAKWLQTYPATAGRDISADPELMVVDRIRRILDETPAEYARISGRSSRQVDS